MPLTLLLSGALLPAELAGVPSGELAGALDAPVLVRWLRQAALLSDQPVADTSGDAAWIAVNVFGLESGAAVPGAPYAWAELTGSACGEATIWHADPVYVAIGRDSLVLQGLDEAPPGADEADALIAVANACLAGSGARLQRTGAHWFLHATTPWALRTAPLEAALGGAFTLPVQGADAQRWSRLHNAIQMSWHEHPVNERREAEGAPPINALWLHGGGRWAPLPALRWPQVVTARPVLRGAARAAGAAVVETDVQGNVLGPLSGGALVDLPLALSAARVGDWPAWLAAMAALDRELARVCGARPAQPVELVLTASDRVRTWRVQSGDRLRFWRRTDVATALSA